MKGHRQLAQLLPLLLLSLHRQWWRRPRRWPGRGGCRARLLRDSLRGVTGGVGGMLPLLLPACRSPRGMLRGAARAIKSSFGRAGLRGIRTLDLCPLCIAWEALLSPFCSTC